MRYLCFLLVAFSGLWLPAAATTYYSNYGQTRNQTVIVAAGNHKFVVDGIARNLNTEWYVNGNHQAGQNDFSGNFAVDPDFTYSIALGTTTKIRAIVYDATWKLIEYHEWLVTCPQPNLPPSVPGPITVTSITRGGATVNWGASTDPNPGTTITYEVEFGVNNTPGWTSAGTTTGTSRALNGLKPNTTYVVRVRARDNFNPAAYSGWNEKDPAFTTLANRAPTVPGTITITGLGATGATVNWGASSDADGDAITYEVEFGVNNTPGWTSAGTTTGTSRALSGLKPNTTYVVRVRARDNFNPVAYSAWNEKDPAFTTPVDNLPPSVPGPITVTSITRAGATVSWGASTDPNPGTTVTYEIEYGENNTFTWTSAGTTTTTSKALSGLKPNTTYVVRVRARDNFNPAAYSGWIEKDPGAHLFTVAGRV